MSKKEKIIGNTEKTADKVGMPISLARIMELYPKLEPAELVDFVRRLRQERRAKFCLSDAPFKFSKDTEIRFFKINLDGDKRQIIFLGQGKIAESSEIFNRYAAETWGYSVLAIDPKDERVTVNWKEGEFKL